MLSLGSIRGTTITIDFNFIILVLFFVVMNYNPALGVHYALLWIPVLFVSVLIHELAHAGMIGLLGFGSSDVVLTGMGGVTINRRRAKPWQDLLISLAGPFSSFALAGIVYLIIRNTAIARQDPMLSALMPLLLGANLFWGVFNLIPIAPLDGGHAVREFLRMFLRDRTAFVIAVWIGIVVGTAVAVIAVFTRQFFLALYLAWFVWNAVQSWQHFRRYGTPGD